MSRREFNKSTLAAGATVGLALPASTASTAEIPKKGKKYRAGIVGLGWMGLLYGLGKPHHDTEHPCYISYSCVGTSISLK